MNSDFKQLQEKLGYVFVSSPLLLRALTHKSCSSQHNERLEFLGDAILNMAISDLLFHQFAQSDEGHLTRIRAHLVRQDTLYQLAEQLGIPLVLRLSDAEAKSGGAHRPSILADALEAVIGAVYVDGGFKPAKELVQRLFAELLQETQNQVGWGKDPKTELQEWLQARKYAIPVYRIVMTRGRAHDQIFVVECSVVALNLTQLGEGKSRRAAEQEAAKALLKHLKLLLTDKDAL